MGKYKVSKRKLCIPISWDTHFDLGVDNLIYENTSLRAYLNIDSLKPISAASSIRGGSTRGVWKGS